MFNDRRLAAAPQGIASLPCIPDDQRVYAIGDIHGRLDLFERLIATIREDNAARGAADVRIILLGDLIDRGPSSAAIVERCRAFADRSDKFVVLKGNHEAMMVHAVRGNFSALALWLRSGGDATLCSWGMPAELVRDATFPELIAAAQQHIPVDVLAWLDALPLTQRIGSYLFVHAGIRPGVALAKQTPEDLMWIRQEFLDSPDDHSFIVVHGHSISEDGPVIQPNRIGIDTGGYRTGVLTALALEGDRRWTLATDGHAG